MRVGVTMFVTDRSIGPVELAREVAARGFASLFVPEHTHIPLSRRTPYPGGGELPEEYYRTYDPFVALTAAAVAEPSLTVGTGICLVAQRDAIVLAKEVASIDHLTGGRFVFGVGVGWNVEEMNDHGVDRARRRAMVREKVLAMRALWTDDAAGFDGEFVRFERSASWPKPVQRPHPPVLLGGGAGPRLFADVVEWADGWMPIGGRGLRESLPLLRRTAEEAGRDPDTVEVVPFSVIGTPGKLEHYAELGIDHLVLGVPSGDAARVLPVLDTYAGLLP